MCEQIKSHVGTHLSSPFQSRCSDSSHPLWNKRQRIITIIQTLSSVFQIRRWGKVGTSKLSPQCSCCTIGQVLEDEKVAGSSLFSLTVLPSHRRVIGLPRSADDVTRIPSKQVLSKPSVPSVSWADVARRRVNGSSLF